MKSLMWIAIAVSVFCSTAYLENHYTREECKVVRVESGVATFEDECGYRWNWEIEENEYFEVGDKVDLKMYNNGSSNYIEDDEIIRIVFQD